MSGATRALQGATRGERQDTIRRRAAVRHQHRGEDDRHARPEPPPLRAAGPRSAVALAGSRASLLAGGHRAAAPYPAAGERPGREPGRRRGGYTFERAHPADGGGDGAPAGGAAVVPGPRAAGDGGGGGVMEETAVDWWA